MLKLLLRQPLNAWKELGLRTKIEILLLGGVVCAYLTARIHALFAGWLQSDLVDIGDLNSLNAHIIILILFISAPFIFARIVSKQPTLHFFYGKPLSPLQLLKLLTYYFHKYQLVNFLIALPIFTALLAIDWMYALPALFILALYDVLILLLCFAALQFPLKKNLYISLIISIALVQSMGYLSFYWLIGFVWWFDVLFLAAAFAAGWFINKKISFLQLEEIFPPAEKSYRRKKAASQIGWRFPRFLPGVIQTIFKKELLSLWRNPAYRRLKFITLIIYVALLAILSTMPMTEPDKWLTILTGLIIWLHYSNHFNEKYVLPEPAWYFHTIPIRFHQLWLARFLSEFIYMILLLISYWIFLLISGSDWLAQINLLSVLILFSGFVLAVMINFQIMFYDEPRLAGYAYHFTMIFLVIMILNYYLVGPLISLILLNFYFYKSYRYFSS